MTGWSPLGGTEWMRNPDWVLDEDPPEHPVSVPLGNGHPFVPYTYRGADFSEPAEVTVTFRPRARRVREATALDDPALRYILAPVSAPAWWIRDWEAAS